MNNWRAGSGRAGNGRAGNGRAGNRRAGKGRAGNGRAGKGRAGNVAHRKYMGVCLYRFRLLLYIAAKSQFFDISEWSFVDWFCRTFPWAFTEDHLRWKFLGTNWHDSRNNGQQNQFLIDSSEMTPTSPWLHGKKVTGYFFGNLGFLTFGQAW